MGPAKIYDTEILVTACLVDLSSLHRLGLVKKHFFETAIKTSFIFSVDNSRTPGFWGSSGVEVVDIISSKEDFTKMKCHTGRQDSRTATTFSMFTNEGCNYPTKHVPDDITKVAHNTEAKILMDASARTLRLLKKCVQSTLPKSLFLQSYLSHFGEHLDAPKLQNAVGNACTVVLSFFTSPTHPTLAHDRFFIQKIKGLDNTLEDVQENFHKSALVKRQWRKRIQP